LNNLNKELQGKDNLITNMYDNIKTSKVKLWLWENQLKLRNLLHFLHLKSLDTIFPEHIQEHSQYIFCFKKSSTKIPGLQNYKPEFLLALPSKVDIKNAPENLKMELTNFQCDNNLNQKFSETNLQDFFLFQQAERKVSCTQIFGV
jgi:hypothetical protein